MGSSPVARLILSLLLCGGASSFLPPCHGAAEEAPGYVTVSASSFKPSSICSAPDPAAPPPGNGTSAVLRLTHRHGPCAPSLASSLAAPSVADTLRADQRRAEYILQRVSGAGAQPQLLSSKASAASVPASWGYDIGTLNYVVTASLGTPGVAQTLEVDTGSDLSWVQCKPCAASSCYSQKDPLFDPSQSSSYAAVPCGGSACAALGMYTSGCSGAQCGYVVSYGDGSNTTGVYSSDTLTLTPTDAVQGFLFGCGHAQTGLFTGIDGLLGLGRLGVSLVGQTAAAYGGAFSYCLPTKPSTTGYLALGGGGGVGLRDDAAADVVERADVLHRDADGDQRGRAAAERAAVGVLRRDGGGHGHGGHEAAHVGVRGAAGRVPERRGAVRVPAGAAQRDPRHVLQLRRVRHRDAAHRGAHLQQRRHDDAGRRRDPVLRVPRVRAQRQRRRHGHPRERAAALLRGADRWLLRRLQA
ncbi:unnamed protein product [Urochloa humidicola]